MKKISFVVIAYNEESTIKSCVGSIIGQEELKKYSHELIVINDGSQDKTVNVVKNLRTSNPNIHLIDFKINKGRGFARHEGMKRAKGDYIAFIDADITLPEYWLKKVIQHLDKYDAVGGIAIPDGDSTYISQKFNLRPKPLPHTHGITGSNSIYKKDVFKNLSLDPSLRGGEDTDIVIKMLQKGYKVKLINYLIVDHHEDINFRRSLKRMYSFGKGATNLLNTHKKIRLPDITFFLFVLLSILSAYLLFRHNYLSLIFTLFYPLTVSYLHLVRKFNIENAFSFIFAGFTNYFMIVAYFIGRLVGYFRKE